MKVAREQDSEASPRGSQRKRFPLALLVSLILSCIVLYAASRWDGRIRMHLLGMGVVPDTAASIAEATGARQERVITPEFSELAKRIIEKGRVPGLSLGIVRLDAWPSGPMDAEYGSWGIMSESGANVTADTLFNIGSCSKAVLSLSMGLLIEDFRVGRNKTALPPGLDEFTWETRVHDLLPEAYWELPDECATKEANIADVLSHMTGLPRHDFAWYADDSTLDVVRRMRHLKMTHGLRMQWDYNNQMYILAAHILSTYAGMPYTAYATERVFRALGMSATTFSGSHAAASGHLSHAWSATGRRIPLWLGANATEMLAGPGGVISSARDMTKWMYEILPWASGLQPVHPSFEPTTARAVVLGRAPVPNISVVTYGMGWFRMSYHGHEVQYLRFSPPPHTHAPRNLYHSGSIPGFRALTILLPTDGAGVVALANTDDLVAHEAVAFNAVHRIVGLPLMQDAFNPPVLSAPHLGSGLHRLGYPRLPEHLPDTPPTSLADSAPPSPPLEHLAGTYSNAGYGTTTLCAPTTPSPHCVRVRAAYARAHNATRLPPALLAEWPRLLATHMRLERVRVRVRGGGGGGGAPGALLIDTFWMTVHYVFPEGYGEDGTPFDYELFPPGYGAYVECVVRGPDGAAEGGGDGDDGGGVEGCGLFLTLEGYLKRKRDLSVRERADVWFEKVA
ncbi:beta-lactamase/transpeptidase-like protein [Trametes punicea]|nr:beta-lactamase/transpeptidase-like protein [Trametes punicea]